MDGMNQNAGTVKAKLIAKVKSLSDLRQRGTADERYRRLAIAAAANLGRPPLEQVSDSMNFTRAMQWLSQNADETNSESGVVAEINFVRSSVQA